MGKKIETLAEYYKKGKAAYKRGFFITIMIGLILIGVIAERNQALVKMEEKYLEEKDKCFFYEESTMDYQHIYLSHKNISFDLFAKEQYYGIRFRTEGSRFIDSDITSILDMQKNKTEFTFTFGNDLLERNHISIYGNVTKIKEW